MACDTEAAIHEPPSTGDCGSVESPSLTRDVVERQAEHVGRDLRHDRVGAGADVGGRARDLGVAVGGQHDADAIGICSASQTPVAMPQPTSSLPSRIERGSGLRLSQPNASAPWR